MPELEQALTELGANIAWPPTPRLRVETGVVIPLPAVRHGRGWGRPLAVAAAVVLIVAGLLAFAPTRDAIAGFLNLHTTVQRVPHLQTPSPRPGQSLGLGTPMTKAELLTRVPWRISIPSALGEPDQVYLALPPIGPSGGEVTFYYKSGPVLVTEARGSVNEQFFLKTIGPGTTIENVAVNGHGGWWISGAPHTFVFTDANGNPYFDTLRLATNTLIFDDNGTVVRIEANISKQQALRIAGAM
ncbi:MAG TPA: hypothetical protein VGX27_10635 [Candidatus Dormibacteraeota bacterium]|nr:hypothetical protein [Candidatus Dormibacteraeota bacterium]